jgi:coatomer subunit beta
MIISHILQEIARSANAAEDDTGKYRQLLVRTLHAATIRFPDVASHIVPVLMEFLSDTTYVCCCLDRLFIIIYYITVN